MSLTTGEISQSECLSIPYVAKIMRALREGGLVTSVRGQSGGYRLARTPGEISVSEALAVLGGRLFEGEFCDQHAGHAETCTRSTDCSIRSLWRGVQSVVDQVLRRTSLKDLVCNEEQMDKFVTDLVVLTGGVDSAAPAYGVSDRG